MRLFGKKSQEKPQSDWAVQAADTIERAIDGVREKAVIPLTTIARAVVFGLLAAIVGISAVALFAIALVRLLDVYLDNLGAPEGVWFAHAVAGLLFVILGAFLWSKRTDKAAKNEA